MHVVKPERSEPSGATPTAQHTAGMPPAHATTGTHPAERERQTAPAGATDTTPPRPGWMTILAVLATATLVVGVARDLFWAPARAVEVWLGFEVTGSAAIATAPIHWAIFAAGAWAFWTGRAAAVPWAAAYLFYAAVSHLVWSEASPHGRGWPIGLVQAALISAGGWVLLQLHALDAPTRRARR